MHDNEKIIRDFIAAWSSLDADRIVSYFAPDGVYHNMPIQPVRGHEALRSFISAFLQSWTATDGEIVNIICQGRVVFAERIDRTKVGDKQVDLPCCGVFEMDDGKITAWRDYFDMGTYAKALAG